MENYMSKELGIRAYGNKILVAEVEYEKTTSMLITTGTVSGDARFLKGIVVGVGDPIPNLAGILIEPKIKVGDVVVYNKYNTVEIEYKNKKYKVVPYHEVQAIMSEDTEKFITTNDSPVIPHKNRPQGLV